MQITNIPQQSYLNFLQVIQGKQTQEQKRRL